MTSVGSPYVEIINVPPDVLSVPDEAQEALSIVDKIRTKATSKALRASAQVVHSVRFIILNCPLP